MGATIWILSLVVLAFSWWILAGGRAELPRALTSVRFCLLVTAHPDDECMFFAPTLLSLKRAGVRVSLLCLSEGNCDGLGGIRKEELKQSALLLGIPTDRVSVLNVPDLQDGPRSWDPLAVQKAVLEQLSASPADMILTFDGYGVSGHPNHISIYHGIQGLIRSEKLKKPIVAFSLSSISLLRKFTFILDLPFSYLISAIQDTSLGGRLVFLSSPSDYLKAREAMFAHSSQLVWFRHLYISFSRYMVINTLQNVNNPDQLK